MTLVKPVRLYLSKKHLDCRLQLRDERAYAHRLLPIIAPIFVAFGFVDIVSIGARNWPQLFGLRIVTVFASWLLWTLSRGRAKYGLRFFLAYGPYVYCVQFIMIKYGLAFGPYFAGMTLVMITATMLFPVRTRVAAPIYVVSALPTLVWVLKWSSADVTNSVLLAFMVFGAVLLCTVNSSQLLSDIRSRLIAAEALSRDLGKREREIREKASELLKRQTFETQFSPQVVAAVLTDPGKIRKMSAQSVVVIVFDIENSTTRAKLLLPAQYKEVVEEVFDIFASACLRWDITIDKFTGDGAQAFSGAPVKRPDDLQRAIAACRDSVQMIAARNAELSAKWGTDLNVRFSICEGDALVGFLGRGTLKSFTAIGETVSLAHRLCSVAPPYEVAAYSRVTPIEEILQVGLAYEQKQVENLKGFGAQKFSVSFLRFPMKTVSDISAGRCPKCETPMMFEENELGIPKVVCPGCDSRSTVNAA